MTLPGSSSRSPQTSVRASRCLSVPPRLGSCLESLLQLGFEVEFKSEEGLLDVGGDDAEEADTFDAAEFTGLLACFFELEGVEGLVELVYFGLDFGAGEDCHVVVEGDPV